MLLSNESLEDRVTRASLGELVCGLRQMDAGSLSRPLHVPRPVTPIASA